MRYLSLTINGTPIEAPKEIPPGGTSTLNTLIGNGLILVFTIAALFAVFIFIRGGIEWMMSGGEKQKIEQARQRLVYGILGLLLVLLSFFVVNFFLGLFKVGPI